MYTVAIADDNNSICLELQNIFINYFPDFQISGMYSNGEQIIRSFEKHIPDIVITDIRMPKADGIEVCKKIRNRSSKTKIILLSAYEDFGALKEAIRYNVDSFVSKPFSVKEITKAIEEVTSSLSQYNYSIDPSTAIFYETRNRILTQLKTIYETANTVKELTAETVLLNSIPINKTNLYEIEYQCDQSLKHLLDHESNMLSSFFLSEDNGVYTAVAFCLNKEYLEQMLESCIKEADFSDLDFTFTVTEKMNLSGWQTRCLLRLTAKKFAQSLTRFDKENLDKCVNKINNIPCSEINVFCEFANRFFENCGSQIRLSDSSSLNELQSQILSIIKKEIKTVDSVAARTAAYIKEHYSEPTLSSSVIAKKLNLNNTYLGRKFKETFDQSITTYIKELRIEKAKILLIETDLAVSDVAKAVGFSTTHYFYKTFKEMTGTPPQKYSIPERNDRH